MNDEKLYVVETVQTFIHRYVVRARSLEHAYDEVTMIDSGLDGDAFEPVVSISLPEAIVDGKGISLKKFEKMITGENVNSPWMGQQLIRNINYHESD